MNCDSCHQIHDANTSSGTYILEAPSGNITDPNEPLDTAPNDARGGTVAGVTPQGNNNADYTPFCDQCHYYMDNDKTATP